MPYQFWKCNLWKSLGKISMGNFFIRVIRLKILSHYSTTMTVKTETHPGLPSLHLRFRNLTLLSASFKEKAYFKMINHNLLVNPTTTSPIIMASPKKTHSQMRIPLVDDDLTKKVKIKNALKWTHMKWFELK